MYGAELGNRLVRGIFLHWNLDNAEVISDISGEGKYRLNDVSLDLIML